MANKEPETVDVAPHSPNTVEAPAVFTADNVEPIPAPAGSFDETFITDPGTPKADCHDPSPAPDQAVVSDAPAAAEEPKKK